jgi:HK97 family phage major capsid protein
MEFDLDKLATELSVRMGGQVGPMVAELVQEKVKDLGLDRVDRKFGMFPGADEGPRTRTKAERAAAFLRSAILHTEPGDEMVRKALSEGDDGAGGYLVPADYRAELIRRLPELSELFPFVRRVPVSGDSGEFPKLSSDVSITWGRSENDALTETDPAFTQLTWTARNMSAITYLSRELVSDANPNIVETITALFSEAVAAERDKMIAVGNGSSQPMGIYSAAGLDSVAVGGALSYTKLVELKFALRRKYHRGARWIMNSTNLQRVTALVDDNGMPIFRDALVAGESPRLLGKEYSIQDDLPDSTVLFGDLSQYLWFDRERMVIESTSTGGDTFKKHQVAIKLVERCDGKPGLAEAFVKATGISG